MAQNLPVRYLKSYLVTIKKIKILHWVANHVFSGKSLFAPVNAVKSHIFLMPNFSVVVNADIFLYSYYDSSAR